MTDEQNTTPKRRARTLEEREAALKAELTKLREQAFLKDTKKLNSLIEKRSKMQAQFQALHLKRQELDTEIEELQQRLSDPDD
jgi:chromosome segregation ATPase